MFLNLRLGSSISNNAEDFPGDHVVFFAISGSVVSQYRFDKTGINPSIDRAPILGQAPGLPGFYNTVTANGYTLGPIVGRITADAILHAEAVDPHYRVERFG